MSGISFATDNFQKPNTSFLAFEMASILMKNGALREKSSGGKSFMQQDNIPFPNQQVFDEEDNPFGIDSFDEPFISSPQNPNPFKFRSSIDRQNKTFPKAQTSLSRQQSTSQYQSQPRIQSSGNNSSSPIKNQSVGQTTLKEDKKEDTPPDWLAPKIYKGSSNV